MNLKGKRILITGANGFIGGRLAERLTEEEGALVRGLVRPRTTVDAHLRDVQVARGDMTDTAAIKEAVDGCNIVIHCAAMQGGHGRLADFRQVNVQGTLDLVNAAGKVGAERFIHISTVNAYGIPPPANANADSPLALSGDYYSRTKAEAEEAARQLARERDLPFVIVRPACTYGPRSNAWTLQPIARLRQGRPVLIGSGDGICNAIYIDNLVDLVLLTLKNDAAVGQAFIGAEGRGVTWQTFYCAYGQMIGIKDIKAIPRPAALAAALGFEAIGKLTRRSPRVALTSVRFYSHKVVFDIAKSIKLLGYTPRVTFEEGMRRTREWLAANGKLQD